MTVFVIHDGKVEPKGGWTPEAIFDWLQVVTGAVPEETETHSQVPLP